MLADAADRCAAPIDNHSADRSNGPVSPHSYPYPVDELFSRQQVQMLTGIPDDVLGFWMKEGLLVPEAGERRQHRRFRYVQLNIAVVLNAMRSLGANVGVLRSFSKLIQSGIVIAEASGLDRKQLDHGIDLARMLNRFRRGEVVEVANIEWLEAVRSANYKAGEWIGGLFYASARSEAHIR